MSDLLKLAELRERLDAASDSFVRLDLCAKLNGESFDTLTPERLRELAGMEAELKQLRGSDQTVVELEAALDVARKNLAAAKAERDQLIAERDAAVAELKSAKSDHGDFLAFMGGHLADWPCLHDPGGHKATPPIMWPELIGCIVAKAKQDLESQLQLAREGQAKVVEVLVRFRLDCLTDAQTDIEEDAEAATNAYDAAREIAGRLGLEKQMDELERQAFPESFRLLECLKGKGE